MQKQNNLDEKINKIVLTTRILFPYILKRWWQVLIIAIIFGVLGVAYAWMQQPVYTAEMLFTTEGEKGGQMGLYSSLAAQFGVDISSSSNSAFEGDNLIELLKTRTLVEKTLLTESPSSKQLLINEFLNNHKLNIKWASSPTLSKIKFEKNNINPDRLRDSVMTNVIKMITKKQLVVERKDKKLNYITIKMSDNDEVFAKNFIEVLVKTSINYYVDYKSQKARKNYDLLAKQVDSVKGLLFGNIETIAETNDLNVNPIRQKVRTSSQKTQVNAQANTALYTELTRQFGLAQVALQRETPLIQIIDSPVLPLEKKKLGRLMGGIMFAFVGGFLYILFLIIIRWKEYLGNKKKEQLVQA